MAPGNQSIATGTSSAWPVLLLDEVIKRVGRDAGSV